MGTCLRFEKGKAAALEAALSILSSRSRTKFNPLYLAYFYRFVLLFSFFIVVVVVVSIIICLI